MRSLLLLPLTALTFSGFCYAANPTGGDKPAPKDLSKQVCDLYKIASAESKDLVPLQNQHGPACSTCVPPAPGASPTPCKVKPPVQCPDPLKVDEFATFDARLSAIDALGMIAASPNMTSKPTAVAELQCLLEQACRKPVNEGPDSIDHRHRILFALHVIQALKKATPGPVDAVGELSAAISIDSSLASVVNDAQTNILSAVKAPVVDAAADAKAVSDALQTATTAMATLTKDVAGLPDNVKKDATAVSDPMPTATAAIKALTSDLTVALQKVPTDAKSVSIPLKAATAAMATLTNDLAAQPDNVKTDAKAVSDALQAATTALATLTKDVALFVNVPDDANSVLSPLQAANKDIATLMKDLAPGATGDAKADAKLVWGDLDKATTAIAALTKDLDAAPASVKTDAKSVSDALQGATAAMTTVLTDLVWDTANALTDAKPVSVALQNATTAMAALNTELTGTAPPPAAGL
jgi:hypothetical protein